MEEILSTLRSVNIDPTVFGRSMLLLAIGSLLLGSIGRFVFGKKSGFSHAVSSSIGILFVYATAMVVYSAFPDLACFMPALPYVHFNGSALVQQEPDASSFPNVLFVFRGSHYTAVCTQVLNMIILAFLANLLDRWLPAGKNFFTWLLSKCATVIGAIVLQLLVNWLLNKYLPQGIMTYAPTILLGLLILLLLVGALKFVVGALLSTVHPVIGAFYTFFFATIVGKSITKAVLTTGILTGLVFCLNYMGCTAISIASAALIAYIPLAVLLLLVWYLVNKIML